MRVLRETSQDTYVSHLQPSGEWRFKNETNVVLQDVGTF